MSYCTVLRSLFPKLTISYLKIFHIFLQLFFLCLNIVDKSASKVLDSEEWEDISRELMEIILMRNTLR